MAKKKYTKIGAVLKGDNGPFIVMGNERAKDAKYNYDVQIMVKDSEGNKITLVKNPLISLRDPRTIVKKDGTNPKVPEVILFELSIAEDVNE